MQKHKNYFNNNNINNLNIISSGDGEVLNQSTVLNDKPSDDADIRIDNAKPEELEIKIEAIAEQAKFTLSISDFFGKPNYSIPNIEIKPIDINRLKTIVQKARRAFQREINLKYKYEFFALLQWFDSLIEQFDYGFITSNEVSHQIIKFISNRWHKLKQYTSLNITFDDCSIRNDFFCEIANEIVNENTSLCHILTPGVTNVIPDSMQTYDDEGLIGNTEPLLKPGDTFRRLLSSLVYIQNEDGSETLLDAKSLFQYALDNDKVFFENDTDNTEFVTLTANQKKQIERCYPDLYLLFLNNYNIRHTSDFDTLFSNLINAVESSSGAGWAFFNADGRKKVRDFYDYWVRMSPTLRKKYGNMSCDNSRTLSDNLILIFTGVLIGPHVENPINLEEDLGVNSEDSNQIIDIFSCTQLMATRLKKVQKKILSQAEKLEKLDDKLNQFDFRKKNSKAMDDPDFTKLLINIISFTYGTAEISDDLRDFIDKILPTISPENFLIYLKQAILNKYYNISSIFLAAQDITALKLMTFLFKEEINLFSLDEIKKLIYDKWKKSPELAFKLAKSWIHLQLNKNDHEQINECADLLVFCNKLGLIGTEIREKSQAFFIKTSLKLVNSPEMEALFHELIIPEKQLDVAFFLLTSDQFSFVVNEYIKSLVVKFMKTVDLKSLLEKAMAYYERSNFNNEQDNRKEKIFIDNLFFILSTYFTQSLNAIDFCILLQKQQISYPKSNFYNVLLEKFVRTLSARNIVGMGVFLDSLSKHEFTKIKKSSSILENRVYLFQRDSFFENISSIIKIAGIIAFLTTGFLAGIGVLLQLPLLITLIPFTISITVITFTLIPFPMNFIRNSIFLSYLKIKSAFFDLFSFHPEKSNQHDFWLSINSRYQKESEKGLLYALEPLGKIGKGALKVLMPFRDWRDGVSYTGKILVQLASGVKNIVVGLSKSFIAPPILLAAGLGQVIAGGGWSVAKETVKRTALLVTRGLAQIALGVFQIISAVPALTAPFIRLAMTAMRKREKFFIETKPEMSVAVDACLRVLAKKTESENIHIEPLSWMDINNADERQSLLNKNVANGPHPEIQSKEAEPFMCVRRQLEKVINPQDRPKFDTLLKFSFVNTHGKVECTVEEKMEIKKELISLKTLMV